MGVVQENSGTFNGTTFTVTLPASSSASNLVVVMIAGNTIVSPPAGFALRTSQVNFMGHYLWDAPGGASSWVFTNSAGQGVWYVAEVASGAFVNALSQNDSTGSSTYTTPPLTPTAGTRTLFASFGSTDTGVARTVSGWTNSFVEQIDNYVAVADYPLQAVATLDVTASGSTAYSTGITYSAVNGGRTAIIGSYATVTGGATLSSTTAVLSGVIGTVARSTTSSTTVVSSSVSGALARSALTSVASVFSNVIATLGPPIAYGLSSITAVVSSISGTLDRSVVATRTDAISNVIATLQAILYPSPKLTVISVSNAFAVSSVSQHNTALSVAQINTLTPVEL